MVRDAKGRSIDDLKSEEFHVFDDGKARPISGFTVERRAAVEDVAPNQQAAAPLPQASGQSAPGAVAIPTRVTVFLFDDMHVTTEDLVHARGASMKVMAGALTGTNVVAVDSISGRVNTGLTRDSAKLAEALTELMQVSVFRSDGMDCPNLDYYQADLIENKHDPVAINDANRKYANCNPSVSRPQELGGGPNQPTAGGPVEAAASRTLTRGRLDVMSTYASIGELVRRMSQLPGQRTLILVTSVFLNLEREALNAESRLIDLAVKSNVTISSLDAHGLSSTSIGASERSPMLGGQSLQLNSEYHGSALKYAENSMAELADGTGGEFFHNNNDLKLGFKELAEAPPSIYVLELSLSGVKANGTLHKLKVEVDRNGVQIEARRGYFLPKPPKLKK